ncbi:putidacin L1 family lectin-like bacteriocin [Pseudomonas sp. 21LCFQ02]|uniref:putidacin L1 family lectin-like bacteriocin n=1 Tax=Pseudomonas sp. 21LCFQ02 TaxID=2957505 RepID=UPI00209B810C|nr:putidacin L1 family lectin-like bacteriocin [Pseudomonas sp. 21LCFQ02]MCO8166851.1 putidacin L1 family lectin-like bacteriocin [Pseudomonas sp. 21LCFQ02]
MAIYYPENPQYFTSVGSPYLPPLQVMTPGQFLLSPNGNYKLLLQDDGNLAIYDQTNGATAWIADTNQPYSTTGSLRDFPTHVLMNAGLYLYDPSRGRVWYTNNPAIPANVESMHLSLQNDGNLVVIDVKALWSSDTGANFTPVAADATVLNPDQAMVVGASYPAGAYQLIFQADGNLVVYDQSMTAVWHSHTFNSGATQAVMQADGNFVLYNAAGEAVWNTGTYGNPGAYAQLQANGAFVIVKNTPVWARFGWQPTPVRPPRRVFYPDHSKGPLPLFGGIGWDF